MAFLGATIAFAKVSGTIKFYSTPEFAKTINYVSKYESEAEGGGEDGGEPEAAAAVAQEEEEASGKMQAPQSRLPSR